MSLHFLFVVTTHLRRTAKMTHSGSLASSFQAFGSNFSLELQARTKA